MIGRLLGGRYEILEQIGTGGMATVYKARCRLLHRFVAIKVLKDELANDEEFVDKFRRESQAAASLSHPNIVNIYDVGTDKDGVRLIHYIVMEYIKGITLKDYIIKKGKLSVKETINYASQIASALQDAHRHKIIHRDIKPQNIMIDESNRIKVMDFGIARAATSSTITTTSEAIGSVHYFSPEQARGGYTDEKSDIYSLGIVMYEMVTGELPYKGQSPITVALKHVQEDIVPPRQLDVEIPQDLERVILRCVEKRQIDRFSNIDMVIIELNKLAKKYKVDLITPTLTSSITNNEDKKIKNIEEKPINNKPKQKKKKVKKKKEGAGSIVLGVLLAFLVTSGIFFGRDIIKNFLVQDEILMPDLIGMEEEEARKLIEDDNDLEFRVLARIKDESFPPGQVNWQDVKVGTKLKKGYPIQVKISDGAEAEMVEVPNIVGENIFEAEKILLRAGLGIGSPKYKASDKEGDLVLGQDISIGEMVKKGTRVGVTVSQGKNESLTKMPSVIGSNLGEAREKIHSNGLILGTINEEESNHNKGVVISQKPKSGTDLDRNTVVEVTISKGGKADDKKDSKEDKDKVNKETPEKPVVESASVSFATRVSGESVQVKVIKTYEGTTETVYNATHGSSEGDFDITVSGPKGSKFDIYHDGVYQTSINN